MAALVFEEAGVKRGEPLSHATERVQRLARIVVLARRALGDAETARVWLDAPHPLFAYARPLALAATADGARQVEDLLQSIARDRPDCLNN